MDLIMKLIDIGTDQVTGSYSRQIELKRGENGSDPFHLRSENHSFCTGNTLMLNQVIRYTSNQAETMRYE